MRSSIIALFFVLCCATAVAAGAPAQLMGSVEAVYHEGLVTFQVDHADAVSISIKVYDLETDALVYDSGPRARTQVSWPAGHDVVGSFRYVVTAWNEQGEVVVSQAAVTKNLTPISAISFDTIPGDTKLLGPNEVIVDTDLQVGDINQGVRLDRSYGGVGGAINTYEEDGSTRTIRLEPDVDGAGGYIAVAGPGGSIALEGNFGGQPRLAVGGTSSFTVASGSTGDASVVMPASSVSAAEMSNEPGVAQIGADNQVDIASTITTTVLARTINAPTSGYVVAMATIDVYVNATGLSYIHCGLDTVGGSIPGGEDFGVNIPSAAADGRYGFNIAPVKIFPVSAGNTTIYGSCYSYGGTHEVWDRRLSLVFVPTAYGSVTESGPEGGDGHMEQTEGYVSSYSGMTQAEIDAERVESINFNLARIQAELAAIQAQADALMAESDNNQP